MNNILMMISSGMCWKKLLFLFELAELQLLCYLYSAARDRVVFFLNPTTSTKESAHVTKSRFIVTLKLYSVDYTRLI